VTLVSIHQPDLLPYSGFWFKTAVSDVFVVARHDQFQKHGYQRRVAMRESWVSHQLVGKPSLVLGLRPEHIAETRPHAEPNQHDFEQVIEVVEPMGMETLVYFTIGGAEICGRVNPNAGATAEQPMKLRADLSNMHLIDDVTGKVL